MLISEFRSFQKVSCLCSELFASNTLSDVFYIPRWWAACTVSSNIVFWKEHEAGGHFASVEKPDVLVADIREFTKFVNKGRLAELVKSGKLKI